MEKETPFGNEFEGPAAQQEQHGGAPLGPSPPGGTWVATLTFSVSAEPYALSAARGSLEGLRELLEPEVFNDLRLVIHELVKNSVQHASRGADSKISFEVSISSKVRAHVTDFGSSFNWLSMRPAPQRESGWGLYIVDRLTDSWGVLREQGTHVWLEIDHHRTAAGES